MPGTYVSATSAAKYVLWWLTQRRNRRLTMTISPKEIPAPGVWMTEKELRNYGRPKWGMWIMIAAPIIGVVAGQLAFWLANGR